LHTFFFIFVSLIIIFTSPGIAWANHCTVEKIAVVAGPWENSSTKTSLTVQTQDGGGESCHVTQTLRLSFETSGVITGQSGGALQMYISSNSSNRNFYLENASGLSTSLVIKAGYGTADVWVQGFETTWNSSEISQSVSIEDNVTTNQTSTNTPHVSSVHYSASPTTSFQKTIKVEVGAGRDRLGTVGSPLEFVVETNTPSARNSIYKWNFGDGVEGGGDVVTHTYEYPGEYVVVLNADLPDGRIVSRANVKIVEPELEIISANKEKIEIVNNSKNEVNLFGRVLVFKDKIYPFPQDTIIKAGKKLSFSYKITGLQPQSKQDVSMLVVGESANSNNLNIKIKEERLKMVDKLKEEISQLEQKKFALIKNLKVETVTTGESEKISNSSEDNIKTEEGLSQAASVMNSSSDSDTGKTNTWASLIKSFFSRTK